MKPLISPEYAAMNRQLHEEQADYGSNAKKSAASLVGLARE